MIDESTITIWTPCWGEKHLNYLLRYALPSLMQPGNLPACGYKHILAYGTTIGDSGALEGILKDGLKGHSSEVWCVDYGTEREATLEGLKRVIRLCINSRTRLLLLMPDTIFANGGIANMRQYARGKPVSVAAPHLRVTKAPPTLTQIHPWDASELVRFALNTAPHQSLSDSFSFRDNGTRKGGISLTRVSDQLTTIIHYLPTVYSAWFTESDAAFFERAIAFRDYDHAWGAHLDKEGRLRVVSDSEFFFAVELTDPGMNRIEVIPGSSLEEHSELGHLPLKAFVGTLKG